MSLNFVLNRFREQISSDFTQITLFEFIRLTFQKYNLTHLKNRSLKNVGRDPQTSAGQSGVKVAQCGQWPVPIVGPEKFEILLIELMRAVY